MRGMRQGPDNTDRLLRSETQGAKMPGRRGVDLLLAACGSLWQPVARPVLKSGGAQWDCPRGFRGCPELGFFDGQVILPSWDQLTLMKSKVK